MGTYGHSHLKKKKMSEHPSMRQSVTLFVLSVTFELWNFNRVLKFYIWIAHEKIADPYFFLV